MYPNTQQCIEKAKTPALSLSEVKEFLKITHDEENNLLLSLIEAVTNKCERYTSIALIFQTWQVSYRQFARISLTLPIKPAHKIENITLVDHQGEERNFAAIHYKLFPHENEVYFKHFPHCYLMRVEYLAGFGATSASIPPSLKMIMLTHLAHSYVHRESEREFPISRYDEFITKRL